MPNSPSAAPVDGVEAAPTPVPGVEVVEVLAGAVPLDALLLEVEVPSDDVVWLELVVDDSGAVALEVEVVFVELLSEDVDDVEDVDVLLVVLDLDELLVELLVVLEVVEWVVELVLEVLVVVVPGHSYDALFVVVPSNEPTVPETCTRHAL